MRKLDKLYTRLVAKYVMILLKLFKLETQRLCYYILVALGVCKCSIISLGHCSSSLRMRVQVLENYIEMDTGRFDCAYPFCIENVVI